MTGKRDETEKIKLSTDHYTGDDHNRAKEWMEGIRFETKKDGIGDTMKKILKNMWESEWLMKLFIILMVVGGLLWMRYQWRLCREAGLGFWYCIKHIT